MFLQHFISSMPIKLCIQIFMTTLLTRNSLHCEGKQCFLREKKHAFSPYARQSLSEREAEERRQASVADVR